MHNQIFFAVAACGLCFVMLVQSAHAASLYFSPASGDYSVGDTVRVRALVSGEGETINAVSAGISYSRDTLSLQSISQSGSVMDFWVQEPSDAGGTVSLEGVVFNGFAGDGEIITLVFNAAAEGAAQIQFSDGTVLLNDGLGTEALTTFGSASFAVGEATASPELLETTEPTGSVVVASATHTDQEVWYSDSNPAFTFTLPDGTVDVDVTTSRDTAPVFSSGNDGLGLIESFSLESVADGTHYLHVIAKVGTEWSEVTTFAFNVDTETPDTLSIQEEYRSVQDSGTASFFIEAHDTVSGIDYYRITIDGKFVENWIDDGTHVYTTPALAGGTHTLSVTAVDAAGNELERSAAFSIAASEAAVSSWYITLALVLIIVLLILSNIGTFMRYRLYKDRCELLLDEPGIKEHMKRDRELKRRLKEEIGYIKQLRADLGTIEKRVREALISLDQGLKDKTQMLTLSRELREKVSKGETVQVPVQQEPPKKKRTKSKRRKVSKK